jgi:hypothetical protein
MASSSVLPPSFGVPPYTNEVEQPDNNSGVVSALSANATSALTGIVPFKQTDVVYAWLHKLKVTQTITEGGDTVSVSPMYPYNWVQQYLLNMQQQYPAIAVANAFDLVQVTNMRPFHRLKTGDFAYSNNIRGPSSNGATNPYAVPAANVTGTQQTYTLPLWLPASVYFDAYWELSYEGLPISGPHNGYVSPQDMSGYARVVTPAVNFAPAFGATLDIAPFHDSGTAATATATATSSFTRIGVLGNTDPATLPGPTNWQYAIAHLQQTIAGRTQIDIPLNSIFMGQIMSITCRLFDPSANSGMGAMITDATVTRYLLQFGGNSVRFDGAYDDVQRRFFDQHQYLPPDGVLQMDLATDIQGWISNANLLNTLREAGVTLHLEFSGAQSNTAYIETVVEGLRWVPLTPIAQQ